MEPIAFFVDRTAPVIVITGVVADEEYDGPVVPVVEIHDAHPATSSITLDGAPFASGTTVSAPSAYELRVTATDAAGNTAERVVRFVVRGGVPRLALRKTDALVDDADASGGASSQLLAWSERGLFDTHLDAESVARLPSLARLDDEQRSVEARVRSYLDANCSMCHGTSTGLRATWDGRFETPLERQHLIGEPLSGDADLPRGAIVVAPGHPELSALWLRDGSIDPALRMPPLGRQTVDQQWLALLERWIRELPSQAASPGAPP